MTKCKCVFLVFGLPTVICLVMLIFYGIDFTMKEIGYDSDIAKAPAILGAVIAVITLCKGLYEYHEHVKRQRIQYLIDFGKKYTENEDIGRVVEYLEFIEDSKKLPNNTKEVEKPSIHQVEMFMRFFEELQLLIDTKTIDKSVAFYLFGYYTKILKANWLVEWPTLKYNKEYWSAYREFANSVDEFDFNYKNVTL